MENGLNTSFNLPLHTYPPEPLDDNVVGVVLSLVHSIVPPVLHVNRNDATHEQLQFILVDQVRMMSLTGELRPLFMIMINLLTKIYMPGHD